MITIMVVIIIAGFLTGITTIMFGFGGGFVVVPLVYHVLVATNTVPHDAMHIAVATSTAVMVVNSLYATIKNYRAGNLDLHAIFPLFYFIGIGSVLGVFLAILLHDNVIKILFIIYMVITIADCLFREGFLKNQESKSKLSNTTLFVGGPIIGVIASMLGVGGSVMTVPLLRRRGYEMKTCVSSANPLSVPVAVMGAIFYASLGWDKHFGSYYLGYINLKIFIILVLSGFFGIVFAMKFIPKISDGLHAKIYVLLLIVVLVAISV